MGNATTSLPVLADTIDLYDQNGNHIFGGLVTESEGTIPKGGLVMEYQITATDWGFELDSKLVNTTYASMDPADILAAILHTYANAGFTTHHVNRGNFLINTIRFNYMPVTKAIQKLAQTIDWDWFVDPNKDLWFFQGAIDTGSGGSVGSGVVAPFNIDLTAGNIIKDSLDIDYNIKNLKNSVYVIGSTREQTFTALTTPDVYTSVNGTFVYPLAYAYDLSSMFVTLGGVPQVIGELNSANASLYQVLYSQAGKFIQFQSDPGGGNKIVTYGNAIVPIIAHAQNNASIALYGEIQDVITDTQITSTSEAFLRAQADLLQYGHAVYDVKFNTRTCGLQIGQTIYMTLPTTGYAPASYPLVIKSVEATGYTPTELIFAVEAIGSDTVTFTDVMTTLLLQEQTAQNTDNTILQVLLSVEEAIILTETITVRSGTRPYKYGFAGAATPPQYNLATYG